MADAHSHEAEGGRRFGSARERRVIFLLAGVVAMSVGDLAMTLTHLDGAGMLESNPLARGIMAFNSPLILAAWKLATVALGVGILLYARRTRCGEAGAWICCALLGWLTLRWVDYNHEVAQMTAHLDSMAMNARWVQMEPE